MVAAALLVGASAPTLSGCLYSRPPDDDKPAGEIPAGSLDQVADGKITVDQIEELVRGFADRYYAAISSACDALALKPLPPETRLALDRFQTRTITAVYDIASNADPFTQLLDLTVVVALTAISLTDEGVAERNFGSDAPLLVMPLVQANNEILEIAARALTDEQLLTLDLLIRQWRKDNPNVEVVSFVRFDNFAASRGKSVIADVRAGTGLLAPVDAAKQALNEARLFAERVFYMAKRAPLLLSMQSSSIMSQIAAMPEIRDASATGVRLADSADRISKVAEELPTTIRNEREAIVTAIESSSDALRGTLGDYERAIGKTDELVQSVRELSESTNEVVSGLDAAAATLTGTLEAAERVVENFSTPVDPDAPPAKPVDPELYARMIADLKGSLVEVNKALESTKALAEGPLSGPIWDRPVAEIDRISKDRVDHAANELRTLIDVVFWRALIFVGACFVLLVLYKGWSMRLASRISAHPRDVVA